MCLLFNIAALQSQVASVQSRETDDGLKLSAKLFQVSTNRRFSKVNLWLMFLKGASLTSGMCGRP